MPTIKLNKTVFEKTVGKKLSLDKLKDRISMLGTDLDHIEGNEIRVEVFPNRPDMLSEHGFARAFASFIDTSTGLRQYIVKKSNYKVIVDKNVTMRPYTACAIVKNLTLNDDRIKEIIQIQEKLATTHGRGRRRSAYGIYPLDSIKFPIQYTARDPKTITFQPLGFDNAVAASQVIAEHPRAKEYAHLTTDWKKYPFFIDANDQIMSMLPFTNSHNTGRIDEKTREAFIECSGTDQKNVTQALNIIVTTLADMGADIHTVDIQYPDNTITTPDLRPQTMQLKLAEVNRLLGLDLSEQQVKQYLMRMGYDYSNGTAQVPAYRTDILHTVDLIEDIAIAYGYENFHDQLPNVSTIGKESARSIKRHKITELLTGLGLLETHTYNLSNVDVQNTKMQAQHKLIPLKSSVSQEYDVLRSWILPSIMDVLSHNKHHEYPQNLYEVGTAFTKGKTETGIQEQDHLAIALCHDKADYTHIRQNVEYLIERLGHTATFTATTHPSFIKGRAAKITIDNKDCGIIGELHPQVLTEFDLELPVAAAEIDLRFLE